MGTAASIEHQAAGVFCRRGRNMVRRHDRLRSTGLCDGCAAVAIGKKHFAILAASRFAPPDRAASRRLRGSRPCRDPDDGLRAIPGEGTPPGSPGRLRPGKHDPRDSTATRAAARRAHRHALGARGLGQHRATAGKKYNRNQGYLAHRTIPGSTGLLTDVGVHRGAEPAMADRRLDGPSCYRSGLALIASPFRPQAGGLVIPRLSRLPPLMMQVNSLPSAALRLA